MALDSEEADFIDLDDARAKAGPSELLLMAKAAWIKAPAARLKAIATTPPAGVAATGTINVSGSATGNGSVETVIHGVKISTAVFVANPVNTIAANIASDINAKSDDLLVTAVAAINGAGPDWKVTVTARHVGTRGNLIRLRVKKDASITGTSFTASGSTLSGGTGDDSLTTALATASTQRHHYYALAHVVTTQLQAVQAQCDTMAGPLVGKRQQFIFGSVDTLGTLTTQVEALNEERGQVVWMKNGESLPCQMAAAWAAIRAVAEGSRVSVNLSALLNPDVVDLWPAVVPPASDADFIKDSEAAAALDVGISPIQIRAGDKHPYVSLSITTHSNDASGNPDARTLTTNYVSVPDAFADEFAAWIPSTFRDVNLRDDALLGDDPLPENVTTPGIIKSMWKDEARRNWEKRGHINGLDVDYADWAFNIAAGNPNRCNATMPITPAPWFTQMSAKIAQRTPTA